VGGPHWHEGAREGIRLWCAEYGGPGPSVILLHGLAGYAEEWAETAAWLSGSFRVVAIEQRGHGRSEQSPADVSSKAFVNDTEMWIERLDLAPTVIVGQSFGGLIAFLVAARRPEFVRALVVVEATPAADPEAPEAARQWLESWPVPFPSEEHAFAFFGGDTAWARAWVAGLEERDGLHRRFEPDVLVSALAEASGRDWWSEWARITCPVLVVRGERGMHRGDASRMLEALPSACLVEIEEAGHDVHLDQPSRWRETLGAFLHGLEG
jgi:pimeloyl-ACP methyl ester carboxylesterase